MTSAEPPPPSQPTDWMQPLRSALQLDLPQCNDSLIQLIANYSSPLPPPLFTLPNQCLANCLLHHYLLHPDYLRFVYENNNVCFFEHPSIRATESSTSTDSSDDADFPSYWPPRIREYTAAKRLDAMIHYSDMREGLQAMYANDTSWQPSGACSCLEWQCERARSHAPPPTCKAAVIYKPHVYNICSWTRECRIVGHTDIVDQVFWDTELLLDNDFNEEEDIAHWSTHKLCTTVHKTLDTRHASQRLLNMWHSPSDYASGIMVQPAHQLVLPADWSSQQLPSLLQLDWRREAEDDMINHYAKRKDKGASYFYRQMWLSVEPEAAEQQDAASQLEQALVTTTQLLTNLAAYQLCGVIVYDTVGDEYFSLFDPMQALTSDQSDSWLRYERGVYQPWTFNDDELATMCYGSEQPPAKPRPYSYAVCSFYRLVSDTSSTSRSGQRVTL